MMHWLKEFKFYLAAYMGRSPVGLAILSLFIYEKNRRLQTVVSDRTDICIEGFPRCANTFAWLAFRNAQNEEMTIAHHKHHAGQVIGSVKRKIPVILLLRDPQSAVSSWMIRNPELTAEKCLRLYLNFYEPILPYLRHVVVAPFDVVTNDYGSIIKQVNRKFSRSFNIYVSSKENDETIFDKISNLPAQENALSISRPTKEKILKKNKVKAMIQSEENQKLLARCEAVYKNTFASYSETAPFN